jgi:uncharacterized membrane protein YdjX (TVP38/TMEM64 family)
VTGPSESETRDIEVREWSAPETHEWSSSETGEWPAPERRTRPRARLRPAYLLAALVLPVLALVRTVPSLRLEGDFLTAHIKPLLAANWLAFATGQVLVAMSGLVPASIMAVFAGGLYGMGLGLAISMVATMFGGWLAFLLSRSMLRPWIERAVRRSATFERIDRAVEQEGWRFVLLLRISPVMPFALTSYGLGLTRLSQREYLIGTLASLPPLVGYVALGALGREGLRSTSGGVGMWHWALVVAGIGVVGYALLRVRAAMAKVAGEA